MKNNQLTEKFLNKQKLILLTGCIAFVFSCLFTACKDVITPPDHPPPVTGSVSGRAQFINSTEITPGQWEKIEIPLSAFSGNLASVNYSVDGWFIGVTYAPAGTGNTDLFIDYICFERD